MDGQENDIFKLDFYCRGHTMDEVCDFFWNPPLKVLPMFVDFSKHEEKTEGNHHSFIRYQRTSAAMLTDRDSVSEVHIVTQDDGSKLYLVKSKDDDRLPEKKDAIRIW